MWPQPAANWPLNTKLPFIYCPGICSTRKNNFVGRSTELKEGFVVVTRDLEFWRDGGRKGHTLVGSSFSMECLLCGAMRLSGWGVEDMGRNCGAGKDKNEDKNWGEEELESVTGFCWTVNKKFWIFQDGSYFFWPRRTLETCPQPVRRIRWSCCQTSECFVPPTVGKRGG